MSHAKARNREEMLFSRASLLRVKDFLGGHVAQLRSLDLLSPNPKQIEPPPAFCRCDEIRRNAVISSVHLSGERNEIRKMRDISLVFLFGPFI